jgi:hypothetical protein
MAKRTANVVVLSLLPFRKSGSKTVNEASIKKALAKSQTIFKPIRSVFSSLDRFSGWVDTPVHNATSVQDFKWW